MKKILALALLLNSFVLPLEAMEPSSVQVQAGVTNVQPIVSVEQQADLIAKTKKMLAIYKVTPSVGEAVIQATKHAVVSGAIGSGVGLLAALIAFPFDQEEGKFEEFKNFATVMVLYNVVHGLVQGFTTGFAAHAGASRPSLSTSDMVTMHVAHHVLTDLIAGVGLFCAGENDAIFLGTPLVVAAVEAFTVLFMRTGMQKEKAMLEELLFTELSKAFRSQKAAERAA
jgi:hypothetical protein